jgi:hypothetical protein
VRADGIGVASWLTSGTVGIASQQHRAAQEQAVAIAALPGATQGSTP